MTRGIAIVGGGLAGSAAAITLARAGGPRPMILERSRDDGDPLCGGFLSWTSLGRLRSLGIDVDALGGHRVTHARILTATREGVTALPAPALGVARRWLDPALRRAAARAGAGLERGVEVTGIDQPTGGVSLAGGAALRPSATILASGKRDLRGWARDPGSDDPAIGLRWTFDAPASVLSRIGDAIELHLFPGGYVGLMRHGGASVNLCLAVRQSTFAAAGRRPAMLLAALARSLPGLSVRLDGIDADRAQAVARVPYGWRAGAEPGDGVYRAGDQAACIPSLAGEGMGIALETGAAAARAITAGLGAARFQHLLRARLRRPVGIASMLWRLAETPATAPTGAAIVTIAPWLARAGMRLTRI